MLILPLEEFLDTTLEGVVYNGWEAGG